VLKVVITAVPETSLAGAFVDAAKNVQEACKFEVAANQTVIERANGGQSRGHTGGSKIVRGEVISKKDGTTAKDGHVRIEHHDRATDDRLRADEGEL